MNYLSEARTVFRQAFYLPSTRLTVANYSKAVEPKDDEVYDEDNDGKLNVAEVLVDEVDMVAREKEIMRMQNKSRLNKTHRNFLFNQPKPDDEYLWDKTLYFSRKQFARYGYKTGIDSRLCFYTPEELADKQEFERVAFPYTIQETVKSIKKEKAEKLAVIKERELKIAQNLSKLNKWIEDLNARVVKKENEAREAKRKRERMLEDIRHELGFKIDFRDPRFKTLMEKKELEAKKAKKAEKRHKREVLLIEKLKEQAKESVEKAKGDEKKEKTKAADKNESSDSDSDDEKENKKKEKE